MTKFSTMIENLKVRREAIASEDGFSLIDVVVTVAIVVALSVGGFIAYSGIVDNAKSAATAAAADQVYTAVLVSENDGFAGATGDNSPAAIVTAYNDSSSDIKVVYVADDAATTNVNEMAVYAIHKDAVDADDEAITVANTAAELAAEVTAGNAFVKVRG